MIKLKRVVSETLQFELVDSVTKEVRLYKVVNKDRPVIVPMAPAARVTPGDAFEVWLWETLKTSLTEERHLANASEFISLQFKLFIDHVLLAEHDSISAKRNVVTYIDNYIPRVKQLSPADISASDINTTVLYNQDNRVSFIHSVIDRTRFIVVRPDTILVTNTADIDIGTKFDYYFNYLLNLFPEDQENELDYLKGKYPLLTYMMQDSRNHLRSEVVTEAMADIEYIRNRWPKNQLDNYNEDKQEDVGEDRLKVLLSAAKEHFENLGTIRIDKSPVTLKYGDLCYIVHPYDNGGRDVISRIEVEDPKRSTMIKVIPGVVSDNFATIDVEDELNIHSRDLVDCRGMSIDEFDHLLAKFCKLARDSNS